MTIPLDVIRKNVESDKKLAIDVATAASEASEQAANLIPAVQPRITGDGTEALRQQLEYQRQRLQALDEIRRRSYFCRVDVLSDESDGGLGNVRYLVSRNRVPGGFLSEDDWMVLSWTSPITAHIIDQPVGTEIQFEPPKRRSWRGSIRASAKFGTILPRLEDTTYRLVEGEFYLPDEAILDSAQQTVEPPTRPSKEYEAAEQFGLTEIIELADRTQRDAMHLPFHETVLIEGPPGSGKTSIGLMRVPCLIDRQWEELGLNPESDPPFHRNSTMQVLVMNEEMIQYLHNLIHSVGVVGVTVSTLGKFFQQVCRRSELPGGQLVRESRVLTRTKFHPLALPAYWSGFQAAVLRRWAERADELSDFLAGFDAAAGKQLYQSLESWVNAVQGCGDLETATGLNLARRLSRWWNQARREVSGSIQREQRESLARRQLREGQERKRAERLDRIHELRSVAKTIVKRMFDRNLIVNEMVQLQPFDDLCDQACPTHREQVAEEWRQQTQGDRQSISEADLVINGWLANHLMLVDSGEERPVIGDCRPLLTHVVLDEAQDISTNHIRVIQKMIRADGTMTLVGDLRQRVSERGHFRHWSELGLTDMKRAVFSINHRQSQPLGRFLFGLHEALYGTAPDWKPSRRTNAPAPRVRTINTNRGLADVVAEEASLWRQSIPGATVGVLYHGKTWSGLRAMVRSVEARLADSFTEVRYAVGRGRVNELNQIDCVIVATVPGTKGLEFDAVIVIDPERIWRKSISEIGELRRNGLYVAASRAKQALSLVVHPECELLRSEHLSNLYELVETTKPTPRVEE